MKTERRHELEKNQLADWLAHSITWCEENARLLVGVVAGILIIGAAFALLSNRKEEREAKAWNTYFAAKAEAGKDPSGLEAVAKADGDLFAGKLADLTLADIALNQGLAAINTNRELAETQLTQAKNNYSKVRKAGDEHLQERADLGMARYYESMGMIDEAKTEYEKLKNRKQGLYVELATQKLAYLEKPATLAFAKWFRDQKPKPKPAGTGFLNPNDLNKLPPFPAGSAAATPTASPSATPVASATATPSASPSASPSATPVASPSASPSATPAATAKPSATPTASPTASAK
jgi:hypothetical protein